MDKTKPGPISLFPNEFGINRDMRKGSGAFAEFGEFRRLSYY